MKQQAGAALLLVMLVACCALALAWIGELGQARSRQLARNSAQTARALAQARQALIGWSLAHKATIYNRSRPGELPCPDLHPPGDEYEGWAGSSDNDRCDTSERRLGRLPWKTLGLPKLLDGAGETLWYLVANPFHDSETLALNSHTPLTEPLLASVHPDGKPYPPAIAIVFAPGRQLGQQIRSLTAEKIEPRNYLEKFGHYDNASSDPSVQRLNGPCHNAQQAPILNDQLMIITANEILPRVLQRVLMEYPPALRRKFPAPPYPLAQEGSCTGTPPDIELEGSDSNWLSRNQWETLLVYQCTDMSVRIR